MNVHSVFEMAKEIDKSDKRNLILNTTLDLISKNGFHGTPISLISEKAGIGAGTIYRYFKNKEELISELFIEIQRRIITAMYEGYQANGPYEERFMLLWLNMINYYNAHPTEFIFMEQHRYAPYLSTFTRSKGMKVLLPVLQFFLEGKKNQFIKHLPLYTIIGLTYGPILAIVKLNIDHSRTMTKNQIESAAKACWDALKLNPNQE